MAPSKEFLEFIEGYPPLKAIGNTPLVKIELEMPTGDAEVFAKYEHLNPGGSIKGPSSIEDACRSHSLR